MRFAEAAVDRRCFLAGALAFLVWPRGALADEEAASGILPRAAGLSPATLQALETSPYVYVSPLRSDGGESACHGEVWFGWLDGAVVLTTERSTWKARAVERGLDRARLWAGDHGRWKGPLGGRNEAFRNAPSFLARARIVDDLELVDRLLAIYDRKYPERIGRWRDKMRRGHVSGERVLLRYAPL